MGVESSSHPLLAFSDEDLPPEGATHTRPLQITIECMGTKVLVVLIDNGSALNVCPFRTALTIGLDMETIIPSPLTIRANDNTSRKVIGTFKAPYKIGPIETIVGFHVMDITTNYNLLLGKAWLHPNGKGGSELQMSGFEFINMANYGLKDERYTIDLFLYCSHEVIAMMKNIGYMPSIGLRKEGKGVVKFSNIKIQVTSEGLGFFEGYDEIKKNLGTLNGNFVKEGENFPYCGFPKP